VHCAVPDAERRRRYAARIRHPGHFDETVLAAWDPDVTIFGPPAIAGLSVIDADGAAATAATVAGIVGALTVTRRMHRLR